MTRQPQGEGTLTALLVDLATRIPALSDSLSDRYLNHATVSRHLKAGELRERTHEELGGDS